MSKSKPAPKSAQRRKPRAEPGSAKPKLRLVEQQPNSELVDVGALKRMMGYALKRAQMAVFEDFMATIGQTKLKPGEFSVLLMIDQTPGLTQSAIANALGIQRANFVPLISDLERRGLARRAVSESDRRSHALQLTDNGRTLLAKARKLHVEHEARVTAAIGTENLDAMFNMLARLAQGISR